jgi:uncharacterized RDD family membrane protein YckC
MPFDEDIGRKTANEAVSSAGENRDEETSLPQAGFGRRAVGFFIDLALISLLLSVIIPIASYLNVNAYRSAGYGGSEDFFIIIAFLFANFFFVSYFTWFHSNGGQTPGKRVMGIRLVSQYGNEAGFTRSLFRSLGYYISYMVFFAGFIWALFDPNMQTWHDKLAGTIVIETGPRQ